MRDRLARLEMEVSEMEEKNKKLSTLLNSQICEQAASFEHELESVLRQPRQKSAACKRRLPLCQSRPLKENAKPGNPLCDSSLLQKTTSPDPVDDSQANEPTLLKSGSNRGAI